MEKCIMCEKCNTIRGEKSEKCYKKDYNRIYLKNDVW